MNVELKIVLLSIVAAIVFIGSGVIVVQMKKPECPSELDRKALRNPAHPTRLGMHRVDDA